MSQVQDTLITLSIYADDIRFITNVSPGKIVSATINDFEALADPGKLVAVVENSGCIAAKYEVTTECNANILKHWSQEASVGPGQYWKVESSIHTSYQLSAQNFCAVVLKDANGDKLDGMNVTFATNASCTCLGHCACTA